MWTAIGTSTVLVLVIDSLTPQGSPWGGLGVPISTLTPAGLLAVIILLIAMGRLVPRRTMDDVIADRNEWRDAARVSESARAELSKTVEDMAEMMRTNNALLQSITNSAARGDTGSREPPTSPPDPIQ